MHMYHTQGSIFRTKYSQAITINVSGLCSQARVLPSTTIFEVNVHVSPRHDADAVFGIDSSVLMVVVYVYVVRGIV